MKKPSVSIIIPTYNRAHLLKRAVGSILNQTYRDFELIIVDDGSTDNTAEVVKSFDDSRLRYIALEENRGASAARNAGIAQAKGDFIAFQDSDDEWLGEKLEKQMTIFKDLSPKVGVVYTGFWKIKDKEKIYIPSSRISPKEGDLKEPLLKENFVTTQTSVVRKECFSKVGVFDEELSRLIDWEFWIRISEKYHFKYLDESLVNTYYTSDSISTDKEKHIMALEYILKKHYEKFKTHRKILSRNYIFLSHLLCSFQDVRKGRIYLAKAFREYPVNLKCLLFLLLSFFGQDTYKSLFLRFYKR